MRTSIVFPLACSAAVLVACASSPAPTPASAPAAASVPSAASASPAASAPATASTDSQRAIPPSESQGSIDSFKASLRDLFCKADGPVRKCLVVPDTAICAAAFDEAWPECTRGVVLHEGSSEEDREAGRKAGGCLKRHFAEKYAPTHAEGCKY